MNEHILRAYRLDGDGGATVLEYSQIAQSIADDKLAWVHLDANQPETRDWITRELAYLDSFVIDALLVDETRPRMSRIGDGALVILRGVNLNPNSHPEDMVSIRLWIDGKRIISIRRRQLKAIGDIVESFEEGKGPRSAGEFIATLAFQLFDRMQPVLTVLDETTDNIEERLLESVDADLRESIVGVRKQAIAFRRYMAPQRDAIGLLRMSDFDWLTQKDKLFLQESFNHVTRYVEDLDTIRERAQIVKDELASIMADRLNKNMYVLSVVAAIFLPLGFLTGLFGVNIGGMPGMDSNLAFFIFCASLTFVVAAEVAIFRLLKWF